jgi:hypothetical protein
MKKDLIYFDVPTKYIFKKFKKYFSNRFFPEVLVKRLQHLRPTSYPAYIKIEGSFLGLVSEEEALSNQTNIIKVRNLERKVVSSEVEKVVKEHIDLYPKFKRSEWNSGTTGLIVKSEEDLIHLYSTMLGHNSFEVARSVISATGSAIIFVKEGSPMVCVKTADGIEPVKGLCQLFYPKLEKAKFVEYSKEYGLTSPIKFY